MKSLSINQIFKNIISENNEANPFHDDFNADAFHKILTDEFKFHSEIIIDKTKVSELIIIILELNTIYEELMLRIENLIIEINLDKLALVDELISFGNFDYFNMLEGHLENIKTTENDSILFSDEKSRVKNIFSGTIAFDDAMDTSTDVCNATINLVLGFSIDKDEKLAPISEKKRQSLISELRIVTNLYVNIKSGIDFFKYEFGELEKEENKIKFRDFPEIYQILKAAGKQRESNLTQEGAIYASKILKKEINLPNYTIENKIIYVGNEMTKSSNINTNVSSSICTTFYFHLHQKKFYLLDSINITKIFDFLITVRTFLLEIKSEDIVNSSIVNQNLKSVPIKIDKKSFIRFLKRSTNLTERTVISLLNYISQPFSSEMNLWSNPLISFKDCYYFLIVPMTHGHLTYQVDNILEKVLPLKQQEKYFIDLINIELGHGIKKGYRFKKIEEKNLKAINLNITNLLVYEMQNTLIVIHVCLFNYPLESSEYYKIIQKMGEASNSLNSSIKLIRESISKITQLEISEIIGVILTNHTTLSGLNIENNFVLDFHLLKNYFKTGEFRRGLLFLGNNEMVSQELSSIKYYDTENDFNKNFLNFCLDPNPIHEIIKNIKTKEYPVVHKEMNPQITRDGVELISQESILWQNINEIEHYLKQLFYFEIDLKSSPQKKHIQNQLAYLIPQVLSYLAIDTSSRNNRLEFIDVFKKVSVIGMSHLIFTLNHLIIDVTKKRIKPLDKKVNNKTTDYKKAEIHLEQIFKENTGKKASLSSFTLTNTLLKSDLDNLKSFLVDALSIIKPKYCSEAELENQLYLLTILIGISKDDDSMERYIYTGCLNFIDILNYNHYYQKARDVCEEILEYSFKNEKPPLIGWYCLFRCYIKQNNVFDAAFYGSLFISSLIATPEIKEYHIIDALYNGMLFFRDFGYDELANNIYNALKSVNLNAYDKQKITLSYFNSRLIKSIESTKESIDEMKEFLANNIDSILSFGQQGTLPWVVFIYNLKVIKSKGLLDDISFFENMLIKLKQEVDKITLETLEGSYFPIDITTKLIFKDSLIKVFETRNFEDFSSELGKLTSLAKNVVTLSLKPLDIDNLLLSGIVLNDNTLTFKQQESDYKWAPFLTNNLEDLTKQISNYSSAILENLTLKKGQLICWLLSVYKNVYILTINSDSNIKINLLENWDVNKMNLWMSKISKFYFDDKGDYPINAQEQDYKSILDELNFSNLEIKEDYNEILFSSSLSLAVFPQNLLQDFTKEQTNISIHEELIKQHIELEKTDFISFHKPITNIVSLKWFIDNGSEIKYNKDKITLEAWIPAKDEDIVVNIGFEKLKPIILEKYQGIIHTDLLPENPLSSTINIFLAHGGKGIEGFRTLYTKHSDGHAYIKDEGIKKLFGSGIIAVLFICNSASISQEIYAQRLVSFTHEILSLGYKAVIAPAWSLNPDISGLWLESFVESLKKEDSISTAVHLANINVAKKGYNDYHGFYSPTGWAAMHLYGNPNIVFT